MDATMQRPSPAQAFAYALAGAGGYPIIPAAEGQNERTRPPPRASACLWGWMLPSSVAALFESGISGKMLWYALDAG
jgi:hypothetical protein